MGALAIVWLVLPVLAFLATALALALGWPRARLPAGTRRRLAWIAALGLLELAPWAIALAAPSAVSADHAGRTAFVVHAGAVVAGLGLLGTLALARALEPAARRRALVWLVPHGLFLAAYLTDIGQDGVGQML